MHYGTIKTNDVANGEGVRVTLFVSGCTTNCPGCQNPEAQKFNYGAPFDSEAMEAVEEELRKPWVQGLTFCGGEPLHYLNAPTVTDIAHRVKLAYPDKDIWCYTGYTYGEIPKTLLEDIDVLVDGEYDESRKDPSLWFRGSSNQRIIDVQESLRKGSVVLWKM